MKFFVTLMVLAFSFQLSSGQTLPPALSDASARITADELTRVYVTPMKILSTEGNVTDAQRLLVPGTGQSDIFDSGMCRMVSTDDATASILLDFGKELTGGIRITISTCSPQTTPRMRVRLGESVSEACSALKSVPASEGGKPNTATNDHAMRDMVLTMPFYGQIEIGNSGFRFARIDLLDKNVTVNLKEIEAVLRYRDIPYVGCFECSDARLTDIWNTGAYTVHLCMQDYLWDGVKRDRLIWLGDMHPETSTIAAVFGSDPTVERTLDLAVEQWPLPQWFNGMSAYSLWYLIIQHDWYMQSGNREFLDRHAPYIAGLVDRIESLVDKDGTERLSESRFLDWPSSTNQAGVE
ncbi:MAG: alpha-L-rhamnosidase, partial [Muribaculaceae bacterium]|nr:alpha-L-rhamnosidase [Muribaculaceae bacterium]